jgi:carboxyl-terminal processing protease
MQVKPLNGKTVVQSPFIGSPAYKAGLRTGDVIVQVNDTRTDNLSTTEVAELLKGPRGTTVKILVEREGNPEPLEFVITRDEIPRFSIDHAFEIKPEVGYIRITQFNETTSQELREKLNELDAQNLKGLILDLRGNPGGLLSEGVNVAEMFLQRGQLVVSHRGRNSRERQYTASRGNRGNSVPLVIVIDRRSASAAEIVSGAIQDHDRGLIVGEVSFGKGLVQTVYPLSENTGLALTTAKYYTPSGRLIQRDYGGVSQYDYQFLRGGSSQTDVRTTDTGRPVYGGGGITPDVQLPEPKLNRFQQILLGRDIFFNFAKRYLAENKTIGRDFETTDAVLERFQQFLEEQNVAFQPSDIAENLDYVKREIKVQLVLTIFGMDDAFRLEVAADPQVQKAIELLPQAEAMLASSRRAQLGGQAR